MNIADKDEKAREILPPSTMPNSAACLIELMVSPPAFARPMIFAPEDCACNKNAEKSCVLSGAFTEPTTVPPFSFTTLAVSRSRAAPKA